MHDNTTSMAPNIGKRKREREESASNLDSDDPTSNNIIDDCTSTTRPIVQQVEFKRQRLRRSAEPEEISTTDNKLNEIWKAEGDQDRDEAASRNAAEHDATTRQRRRQRNKIERRHRELCADLQQVLTQYNTAGETEGMNSYGNNDLSTNKFYVEAWLLRCEDDEVTTRGATSEVRTSTFQSDLSVVAYEIAREGSSHPAPDAQATADATLTQYHLPGLHRMTLAIRPSPAVQTPEIFPGEDEEQEYDFDSVALTLIADKATGGGQWPQTIRYFDGDNVLISCDREMTKMWHLKQITARLGNDFGAIFDPQIRLNPSFGWSRCLLKSLSRLAYVVSSGDEMNILLKAKVSHVLPEAGLQYDSLQPKHVWQIVNELLKGGRAFYMMDDFGSTSEGHGAVVDEDVMVCSED